MIKSAKKTLWSSPFDKNQPILSTEKMLPSIMFLPYNYSIMSSKSRNSSSLSPLQGVVFLTQLCGQLQIRKPIVLLNQLTRFMISELISESETGKTYIHQRIYNLLSIHLITYYVYLYEEIPSQIW